MSSLPFLCYHCKQGLTPVSFLLMFHYCLFRSILHTVLRDIFSRKKIWWHDFIWKCVGSPLAPLFNLLDWPYHHVPYLTFIHSIFYLKYLLPPGNCWSLSSHRPNAPSCEEPSPTARVLNSSTQTSITGPVLQVLTTLLLPVCGSFLIFTMSSSADG